MPGEFQIIALAKQLLAEPDQHRRIAGQGFLHLRAPQRRETLAFAVLEDFAESELLSIEIVRDRLRQAFVNRARSDVEECGDFVERAPERPKLLKRDQIDFSAGLRHHAIRILC